MLNETFSVIFKHCVVLFLSLSFYTPRLAKILLKRQLNRQVFFWHSTSWIKVRTWLYTKITLWPNERNCSKIFTTFHSKGVFGIFTLQSFLCPKPPKIRLHENHSKCRIWTSASSTHFCPIKIDLSGNTNLTAKCKRTSLRSQCWMRLFCDFQAPWTSMHYDNADEQNKGGIDLVHFLSYFYYCIEKPNK